MKALVTGSSGFIGSHLVRTLAANGHEVVATDVREPGGSMPPGVRFVRCDLLEREAVARLLEDVRPEAVLHLAARTDLEGRSVADYAANTDGVVHLLDAIAGAGSVRRLIATSSQLVCRVGYVPRSDDDTCPNTPYGESKVRTEAIVRQRDGAGTTWTLVRPTTMWGPGMSPHYQRFLRALRRGRYLHVGRSPLWKSYGYVENTAWQYLRLLEAPEEAVHRKTFYLADYEPLSLRRWADELAAAMGGRRVPTIPPLAGRLLAMAGDAASGLGVRSMPFNSFRLRNILTEYRFDTGELERVCGPLPVPFDEGVRRTAAWFEAVERGERS